MELNSDDEYYQKYLEYKQQYIMLKQLKNNNELEGGSLLEYIFGKSKATLAKEKRMKDRELAKQAAIQAAEQAAAEQAAAEQAAIEEAANYQGDGTYLVFQINDFSDYPTIKLFNYDNTKKKHPDNDIIPIMKKSEFLFPNAYIVTKNKEIYNYKFINGDTEFQNIYNDIQNQVNSIKTHNCSCVISPLQNNPNNIINTLINNLNDVIAVYSSNLSMKEQELANIMKRNINNIMETGEHQMYILHTLDFHESKFNESTNVKFLEKINQEVNAIIQANTNANANANEIKPYVDFNMIIKIKDDYEVTEDYIFDKIITKDDASYTETYAKINTIIANYDLDKKNKTTSQIKVPNSGRGQNRGQSKGQYQDQGQGQGQGTIYQYPIANAASPPPVYSYPQKYGTEAR